MCSCQFIESFLVKAVVKSSFKTLDKTRRFTLEHHLFGSFQTCCTLEVGYRNTTGHQEHIAKHTTCFHLFSSRLKKKTVQTHTSMVLVDVVKPSHPHLFPSCCWFVMVCTLYIVWYNCNFYNYNHTENHHRQHHQQHTPCLLNYRCCLPGVWCLPSFGFLSSYILADGPRLYTLSPNTY